MSSPLAQGQIVWVTVRDSHGGNEKKRPAVIVTASKDIDPNGTVHVASITTLLGQARFSETVELPSHPAGHPQTKLKKQSEVVCSWLTEVPVADLENTGGSVPVDVLMEILAKVERLN